MNRLILVAVMIMLVSTLTFSADSPVSPNGIAMYHDYMSWKEIARSYQNYKGHIRIITGNETAVAALRVGKKPLPDGSVLANATWNAEKLASFPVTTVPGSFVQVELMVKDAAKYVSTGGWGYARFVGNDLKPYGDDADFVGECYRCHISVIYNDYLFTKIVKTP